jgi:release factor glutamine methyltransferase
VSRRGASGKRGIVFRLRAAGCVFAEDEALLILEDGRDIESLVVRRERGEPLAHVLGWVSFGGLTVEVDPGVFVPRPQTVTLAEHAASLHPSVALDLFSGAGAIASLIAARDPSARVIAAELDVRECLRGNAVRYGFEVFESDVDAGVPVELEGRVDVLTANVPYVPTSELEYVPHDGEPASALDGGDDGLDWTRRLLACAPRWLASDGVLLTEVARHQVDAVGAIADAHGFCVAQLTDRVDDATQNGIVVSATRAASVDGSSSQSPSPENRSG